MLECEIDDAISFVTELLEFQADETERNYPYATRTIKELGAQLMLYGGCKIIFLNWRKSNVYKMGLHRFRLLPVYTS